MIELIIFIFSLAFMLLTEKLLKNDLVQLQFRTAWAIGAMATGQFLFNIRFDTFGFVTIVLILISGIVFLEKEKSGYLARLLCFSPLFAIVHLDYKIIPLLINVNLIYLAFVTAKMSAREKSSIWYLAIFMSLSSSWIIFISNGYSMSEFLKLDELILYFELGYLYPAVLFVPLLLTLAIVINPLTVQAGIHSFTSRWIGSLVLYTLLLGLPSGFVESFKSSFNWVIFIAILWLLLHTCQNKKVEGLDSLFAYFLPWVFVQEDVLFTYYFILVGFYFLGNISQKSRSQLASSLLAVLGMMTIGLVALLSRLTMFSELILLGLMYNSWKHTRSVKL